MSSEEAPLRLSITALSRADELGYLGQQAVAHAVGPEGDYRIVGGHMVMLLQRLYPAENTLLRATLDADAAFGSVEIIGPVAEKLIAQDFSKEGGNLFRKQIAEEQPIEINLLLARPSGPARGIRPKRVDGVGEVDTLPELYSVMMKPPLLVDMAVRLQNGEQIAYRTKIPDLESAVILKTHAWESRGLSTDKDLADLASLFEIRETHPELPWGLNGTRLRGTRQDTARILRSKVKQLLNPATQLKIPPGSDPHRLAALIMKHVGRQD